MRSKAAVVIGVWLAGLGAGAAHAAAMPPAKPRVVPLSLYLGALPSVQVEVGGRPTTFLLDTAGGLTVITPDTAKALGCAPWGQLTGFRMRGDRVDTQRCDHVELRLPGTRLKLATAGVWDFSRLLPKDAPPLGGSIALDALDGRAITLDLAAGRLIVETPQSLAARVAHATAVPVRFAREVGGQALTPLVAVDTRQGRLWMELDCGSDGSVIVNRPIAAALGLDSANTGKQSVSLSLGGTVPVQADASVKELILDGNIGAPVLRRWVITLDLAHQKLWLVPAAPSGGARQ